MKAERDKWYVTRGGGKRRVVCVDARHPYSVVSLDENGAGVASMTEDGRVFSDASRLHPSDLVKEYREPKVLYVNEYNNDLGDIGFKTPEAALSRNSLGTVREAVKYIEVIED